jgi:hypothetical protein
MMDPADFELLRIAVRVLNLRYDRSGHVTEAEIEMLKSYLGGDLGNMFVEDIASAVICRELNLEDYGRTYRKVEKKKQGGCHG